ncbi:MAG: DNA methylase, partial [Verrucomicrobiae bacterium]|nr:DNA methylase [Verrucomicrobiae bacterium]
DVFVCPECAGEIVFWDSVIDSELCIVRDEFDCPCCRAKLTKRIMDRSWTTKYDLAARDSILFGKQVPVLVNYTANRKRTSKVPDRYDTELISKTESIAPTYWFPTSTMMHVEPGKPWGDEWRPGRAFTHIHHLLFQRSNLALSCFIAKCSRLETRHRLLAQLTLTAVLQNTSRMYRWRENGKGGTISGTFYLSSTPQENNVFDQLSSKISYFRKALCAYDKHASVVGNQSLTSQVLNECSVDYIFLDPPFGANLAYSELNFLWESWNKVWTDNTFEAIENKTQGKGSDEYRSLMAACFKEAYRVLKPGRWMTVEFSNTKASVWNSIQTALTDAGFIVANVSALDKKQGSFKAVTTPTAVKQDLVISAYKPNGGFEERFQKAAQTEEGVWDFVRTHLKYLPVTKRQGALMLFVPDRDPRILFDQMIAFYVRKGYPVPISSQEFQIGLSQRFIER